MPLIYLDNSATTKPCEAAVKAAVSAMTKTFGNPSSLYEFGLCAEDVVSDARAAVADRLSCREDEIFFTSGGSESNNTAIFGAVERNARLGKHIVTTAIEHPSVLEPIAKLERQGYEVTRLAPDDTGHISAEQFEQAIRSDTVLVSCMAVNNEVGSRLPIDKIKAILHKKRSPAFLHIDAVQAFGKFELNPTALGADLLSVSAHKVQGIKGAGALYVRKGVSLPAFLLGGGQEKGIRSGTEAVPAIAAFGAAVKALLPEKEGLISAKRLYDAACAGLANFDNVVINSPKDGLPYILNFSFCGYRSETVLHYLERFGVCVSSGSACSRGKGSHVLRAMGLEAARVDSALRVSFSLENTKEEIEVFLSALKGALSLRKSGR